MNTDTPDGRTIVLAGGTGFIGSRLLAELLVSHPEDRVVALTHSDSSARRLRDAGASILNADMTVPGPWQDGVAGADIVIQAAQPATFGRRLGRAAGRRYREARAAMDGHLLDAFDRAQGSTTKPSRLIYVSGNSYFGETGPERRADETMTPRPTGFGPYIVPAVHQVQRRLHAGRDVVLIFPGAVYGDGAWLKQYTLDPLRAGKPIGELAGRSRVTSPIHVDDVARAIVHLADTPGRDLDAIGREVFVVDDEPMTFHEINQITAAAIGITPRYRAIPAPLMRLFAGSVALSYMQTDAAYSNQRMKALGFQLRYSTARTGIPAALGASTPKPGSADRRR